MEAEESEFEREWWGRKSRGMCMLTAVMSCWERIVGGSDQPRMGETGSTAAGGGALDVCRSVLASTTAQSNPTR